MYLRSANENGTDQQQGPYDARARCARKGYLNIDQHCVCGSSPDTKPYVDQPTSLNNAFANQYQGLQVTPAAVQIVNLHGAPVTPARRRGC